MFSSQNPRVKRFSTIALCKPRYISVITQSGSSVNEDVRKIEASYNIKQKDTVHIVLKIQVWKD